MDRSGISCNKENKEQVFNIHKTILKISMKHGALNQ